MNFEMWKAHTGGSLTPSPVPPEEPAPEEDPKKPFPVWGDSLSEGAGSETTSGGEIPDQDGTTDHPIKAFKWTRLHIIGLIVFVAVVTLFLVHLYSKHFSQPPIPLQVPAVISTPILSMTPGDATPSASSLANGTPAAGLTADSPTPDTTVSPTPDTAAAETQATFTATPVPTASTQAGLDSTPVPTTPAETPSAVSTPNSAVTPQATSPIQATPPSTPGASDLLEQSDGITLSIPSPAVTPAPK